MHVAVAASLAAIIPTSISSARTHHEKGALDGSLARRWAIPMVIGAGIGSLLAARAPLSVLAGVFGSVALLIAVKMLLPLDHWRAGERVPPGVGGATLASVIGGISAVMGIGGGTLTVPTLNLCGYPIHRAVGTAAFFGILPSRIDRRLQLVGPDQLDGVFAGRVPRQGSHDVFPQEPAVRPGRGVPVRAGPTQPT